MKYTLSLLILLSNLHINLAQSNEGRNRIEYIEFGRDGDQCEDTKYGTVNLVRRSLFFV